MRRDSLSRLIARSFGLSDVIQPLLPSRFEPNADVPSFNSMSFGADEKQPRPGVPPALNVNPEFRKNLQSASITRKVESISGRQAPLPPYISSDLTEPTLSLRPPPIRKVSARGQRDDEDSESLRLSNGASTSEPIAQKRSTETTVPSKSVPGFPQVLERRKSTDRQEAMDQAGRNIMPAEIRLRQPEQGGLRAGTGGGNMNQPSIEQQALQSPSVTVHIGRIEVRAVIMPGNEPEKKRQADYPPQLTLAEYLKRREKGAQ
ncbi:MAG: hypothetical protein JXA73_18140 [Acidobacteria bacterium]|nr:hypothetical protein [Acidobacteriota bacterium]